MAQDNVEQQVLDGSLWDEFCDSLKEAGKVVQSAGAPDNVFDRAEGYRYLTRLLRGGAGECIGIFQSCLSCTALPLSRNYQDGSRQPG